MCGIEGKPCCKPVTDTEAWGEGYTAGSQSIIQVRDTAIIAERIKLTRIIQHYRDTKQYQSAAAQAMLPAIVNELLTHIAEAQK